MHVLVLTIEWSYYVHGTNAITHIRTLNSRHFAYRTSRTTRICTLTLSTLLVEHIISSIWINRMTRSHWNFATCATTNDPTLYRFSSLYIFVTRGWPTVAETCHQPNKTDTKTVVFWHTYPLPICIKHNGDDASKGFYQQCTLVLCTLSILTKLFFYVLLTVHLSIILVINQLNAQNLVL